MQVPAKEPRCARFGEFEADLRSGELRHKDAKIKLQEKPFQILLILLEHPGEVVTREEFQRRLWPEGTFVDFEHSINVAIKKLREALGDSAEKPRFIETLPRHGYRFIAAVESLTPGPSHGRREREGALTGSEDSPKGSGLSRWAGPDEAFLLRRRWVAAASGATLAIVAVLFAFNVGGLRDRLLRAVGAVREPPLQIQSLAVLPLENLSHDPEQEYFADGLTDALITDLGKISTLRVISRTSVARYKRGTTPLPQIARELNVDAVIEGTVLRSGDRVRVTAQLLEARTDRHLWTETYERDSGEIIRLEKQVALAIAQETSGQLTPAQQTRLVSKRTINPRPYDAYLRGRYLWNKRTEEPTAEAVGYFEQALREDPQFALAYSGLADCYSVSWWSKVNLPLAEKYARKALTLEPDLAEGHASLGAIDWQGLNWSEGVKECKRAIELNPNYAMAHHFYAIHLLCLGQLGEALAENDRALQLDPFSLPVNAVRQYILVGLRQYDRALEQLEGMSGINPELQSPRGDAARIYWIQRRIPEALADERKAATLAHLPTRIRELDQVAATYARSGSRAALVEFAQQLEKKYSKGESRPLEVAVAYGIVGNKGKVVKWLNQSLHDRNDDFTMMLKSAPEFDCVRSDPHFQDVLRRSGLPR